MSLRRNVVFSLTPVFVLASLFSPTAAQEDDPKQAVVEWDSPPGNLERVDASRYFGGSGSVVIDTNKDQILVFKSSEQYLTNGRKLSLFAAHVEVQGDVQIRSWPQDKKAVDRDGEGHPGIPGTNGNDGRPAECGGNACSGTPGAAGIIDTNKDQILVFKSSEQYLTNGRKLSLFAAHVEVQGDVQIRSWPPG